MSHNYYYQDWEMNNKQRLIYFDSQFEDLANKMARAQGITLSQYLSQIRNITTFKAILIEVFSQDPSLANYVEGMKGRDFRLFFERPLIQDIISANLEKEPERIGEEIIPKPRVVEVEQVEKETRRYFKARYEEKKTKITRRTVGYEDEFIVKGKRQLRLRDSKGRFVKRV